jgi:transitional endoplasmic reticulum ATPase
MKLGDLSSRSLVRVGEWVFGRGMELEALRKALEASPGNVPLLMLVAGACEAAFEIEEAMGYVDRALGLEPGHLGARLAKVRLLGLDGRTSEAVVRVEALCEDEPGCGAAWLLRARLALEEGEGEAAWGFYVRAVKLDGGLEDDDLKARILEARGGAGGDGRRRVGAGGDDADWGDGGMGGGLSGLDAVAARDLGLEFSERPEVTFADVGGMEAVKEDIRMKILYPMKQPELFKAYGKKAGGGVLLYGPPGCGKTLLSRATAGEIDAAFFSIGLHQVLDMYLGESESKLHRIFELARASAPAVLFFDEIDALAADRRDMRGSAGRALINQFLSDLDGAGGGNEGVLVLGATNAPWHLDGAFLRPGRFDRVVFVPPPDREAREDIVRIHARDRPVVALDAGELAKRTEGFSGADLAAVFEGATERALREAMKRGGIVPVTGKDLLGAAAGIRPSAKKWFEGARNHALYANQGGLYDDVLEYLGIKK